MKAISFNIKSCVFFIFIFFSFSQLRAQKTNTIPVEKENIMLSIGMIHPIPFGNNVANNSYTIKSGIDHSVWVRVNTSFWIGTKLTLFDADVQNNEMVGTYNDVNIFSFGPMLGYKLHLNQKLNFLAGAGIGYVRYTNHKTHGYDFHDDGTSFWLLSNLEYKATNSMGFYFSASYRRDFLKTTLPVHKNYFDSNYIVLSYGIRFTF